MNDSAMVAACTPYGLLACKIVEQAVLDWRAMINGRSENANCNYTELRQFLKSAWCAELLSVADLDSDWVLHHLEVEMERERNCARDPKAKKQQPIRKPITIDGRTASAHTWSRELGVDLTSIYTRYRRDGRTFVEHWLTEIKRERGL